MDYELRSWKRATPLVDNGDVTSSQQIFMVIGIVGEFYGFVPPPGLPNTTTVILPNQLQDVEQQEAFILQEATQFVATHYPPM